MASAVIPVGVNTRGGAFGDHMSNFHRKTEEIRKECGVHTNVVTHDFVSEQGALRSMNKDNPGSGDEVLFELIDERL